MISLSSDTIIIGAGFSGLAAASKLKEANKDFLILEARDRIGGRTLTKYFDDGIKLELGGQWIGPTQDEMYKLVSKYDIKTFSTYNSGKNIVELDQKIKTYKGLIPKVNIFSLIELELIIRRLEAMAKKLDMSYPWTFSKSKEWDSIGLLDFINQKIYTKDAKKIIITGLETVYGCDLDELSLLHALFYIKSGSSLEVLLNIEGGAQQDRLIGGMQGLGDKMSGSFKDKILFNSAVLQVFKEKDYYEISTANQTFKCKNIVLALPPNLIKNIQFDPPLPTQLQYKLENIHMGRVAKLFCVYNEPFWRRNGFSGQVVADEHAPFQTVFDVTTPDSNYGTLLAFCIGSKLDRLFKLQKHERQELIVKYMVKYFGVGAAYPVLYEDHTWTDETWSKGCYAGVYAPKLWTEAGTANFSSLENIYWAGTEGSDRWYGYIEGAVLSGQKAATHIMQKS